MTTKKMVMRVLCGVVALGAVACTPPMVLVDQAYFGKQRVIKSIMQKNGGLFNQYLRVCTLDAAGKEGNCKDTLVLENVVPGSLY